MSLDQIIQLTPDDDMASLRQRLRQIQAQPVIVVVPGNVALLRSDVNARLLWRYGQQTETSIIIVTRDRRTEEAARRYRLAVHSSVAAIPARRRSGLTTEDVAGAPRLPRPRLYRYAAKLGFLAIALAVVAASLAALALVGAVLAPSATITLTPATEPVAASVSLTAGTQIRVLDSAKGQLPARTVQVLMEEAGQVETTGRKLAPDAPATGNVLFANRSGGSITIPKGTIVRTATGVSIRFRTEEEATIAAGAFASVRVPIKAVDPGPTGNVKAGAISIIEGSLAFQASVINDEDTSGGTQKNVRYVTSQDRNTLRDLIVQKIRANSYTELRKAIQPDDILPAESLTLAVNEATFDKPLDAESAFLGGKVRATVSGLVLSGDDVRRLVAARLRDQVPPGFVTLPGAVSLGAPSDIRYDEGIVTMQITATLRSQAAIDAQEVRSIAAGKPLAVAEEEIARRFILAQPPEIDVEQARLGFLPLFRSRITVHIEGAP